MLTTRLFCALACRLGQKKRVLMGLSDIQGWGAFLQQAVQKDEFVVSWPVCKVDCSGACCRTSPRCQSILHRCDMPCGRWVSQLALLPNRRASTAASSSTTKKLTGVALCTIVTTTATCLTSSAHRGRGPQQGGPAQPL